MTYLIPLSAIEAAVGDLSEEDLAEVQEHLTEASDLAREIGLAWTEVGGSNPAPASVRLAVKRAVLRAFHEDPSGYTEERLGDWSGSRKETELDQTGVYFTPGEERTIRAAAGRRTGVGSVRTPAAYPMDLRYQGETVYTPESGAGEPIAFLAGGDV